MGPAGETFVSGFCKTARKPYDIAVTSMLLRCRHLAPDAFLIASDGAWDLEWASGATRRERAGPPALGAIDVVALLFGQREVRESPRLSAGLLSRAG